jgi:hypothetical protein
MLQIEQSLIYGGTVFSYAPTVRSSSEVVWMFEQMCSEP